MKGFTCVTGGLSDAELVNFFKQTEGVPGLFVRIDGDVLSVMFLDDEFPESHQEFLDFSEQFFIQSDWERVKAELSSGGCCGGQCGVGISEATKRSLEELAWSEEDEKNYRLTPIGV